ncbi:sigma 54-interacting transcriptional regulator, partial [Brevibacillus choshinensis]
LQDGKIRRLGGKTSRQVNMRIIAATNSDLEAMVEHKQFRQDLFYRLNVLSLTIPPLRERRDDIPALIFYFLKMLEKKYQQEMRVESEALEAFMEYDWPGNTRELKNVVERSFHMSEQGRITIDQLPTTIRTIQQASLPLQLAKLEQSMPLKEAVDRFEREYIQRILHETKTMQECADRLGVNISTLVRKKRSLGIK